MASKIDLQWRNGYEPVADSMKIGARSGILLRPRWPDPKNRPPLGILCRHHRFRPMTVAKAGRTKTLQLFELDVRDIDVEDRFRRQRLEGHPLDQ